MNKQRVFLAVVAMVTIHWSNAIAQNHTDMDIPQGVKTETATLAGGCFWCVEAVFQDFQGVYKAESGYTAGHVKNPSYREVCNGTTGHAEAVRIVYDPEVISYEKILEIFFTTHDPTTLNRQGNDVGTQYRSGIYYHSDEQKRIAEAVISGYAARIWDDPIVTELEPAGIFYPAEEYHQNYYMNNPGQGYCRFVINPKVSKARKKFSDLLKEDIQ